MICLDARRVIRLGARREAARCRGASASQVFSCDSEFDDGESYLRLDYAISCTTDTYRAYRAYAVIMMIWVSSERFLASQRTSIPEPSGMTRSVITPS